MQSILLLDEKREFETSFTPLNEKSSSIRVKNLSANWDEEVESPQIVREISFEVKGGEFLGIVGAVGSGKVFK